MRSNGFAKPRPDSFTVALPSVMPQDASLVDVAQAMAEGAILGSYQFTVYRSETSHKDVAAMTILAPQKAQLRQLVKGSGGASRRRKPRSSFATSATIRPM